MNDPTDSLQIKIDKARMALPAETRQAIDAVDWKNAVLGMRKSKGYTFEQLGDLETETELLLCGLLNPEDYPKELESRLGITKVKVNELVEEMNQLVFIKIREELIKITEQKQNSVSSEKSLNFSTEPAKNSSSNKINQNEKSVLDSAGIKIIDPDLNKLEISAPKKPELKSNPILDQKLSNSFQIPTVKTEHTIENISKPAPSSYPPKADPYRLPPE
jgi:hypothetical protein